MSVFSIFKVCASPTKYWIQWANAKIRIKIGPHELRLYVLNCTTLLYQHKFLRKVKLLYDKGMLLASCDLRQHINLLRRDITVGKYQISLYVTVFFGRAGLWSADNFQYIFWNLVAGCTWAGYKCYCLCLCICLCLMFMLYNVLRATFTFMVISCYLENAWCVSIWLWTGIFALQICRWSWNGTNDILLVSHTSCIHKLQAVEYCLC